MPCPTLRRLSAFTLLELVVVLVVSALLFRLAYAALGLVQGQQRVFERRSAVLGQLSSWQQALAADCRHARRVVATDGELHCELPTRQVVYAWRDSVLTRRQGEAADTLPATLRAGDCYWQGRPRPQGLVDEVSFVVSAARDTFYLQATAHYAAQQLLADSLAPAQP